MLNDLIVGPLSSTTRDQSIPIPKDTQRVLAHISPPYVLDGAGSKTMNPFDLIFPDDGVLESGSGFEDKDGIRIASLAKETKWSGWLKHPQARIQYSTRMQLTSASPVQETPRP